jgi:membrane fusion protein, multidrug efflux system
LIIPQKAVLEIQDRNYVFVVGDDQKVRMKSFVPEARIDEYILVKSGLAEGDRIVYEGVQNIKEGSPVKARMISAESVF